jgi:phosphate starvation-inducible protein PhoH
VKRRNSGLYLHPFRSQTELQESAFKAFADGQNLLMTGPAGVGKTIIAMYLALNEVAKRNASRIVIVRSIVPSRDIGFMPGGLRDKISLYETPYIDACSVLYGRGDAYECLKGARQLEFTTTSFARGTTIRDAIVFIDEGENMSFHECDTMITRLGEETRAIICGDGHQSDLLRQEERNGFHDFCGVLQRMKSFSAVEFTVEDVRRSPLVKEYLETRRSVLKW